VKHVARAVVKAQALRQEKEKRHRNIWAHRCTIVERVAQLRALATEEKSERKAERREREVGGGGGGVGEEKEKEKEEEEEEEKKEEEEEEKDEGEEGEEEEKTRMEEKGSGIRVASRRRGRRKGTEAYLPPTYMPSRGFWRILGVPGTMVEAQSWVRGSKPGRRTKDADAHRPVDPPCAGP